MKLILLRHGKTEANEKRLYCGSTDIPLSENGIVELTALKNSVFYPDISGFRVITSGMKRCEQTLDVLYGDIKHEILPELAEMDFGEFEMYSYEQLKDVPAYLEWISGDNETNITPGGESGNLMKARVTAAVQKIIAAGNDTLIVTHGGVIAAVMQLLFPDENKNRYEWQPKPGRGHSVSIQCPDAPLSRCHTDV